MIVVAAYGKLLPQALLDIPKQAIINVHSSLLPQYRGAAPINWAVLNGDLQDRLIPAGFRLVNGNAACNGIFLYRRWDQLHPPVLGLVRLGIDRRDLPFVLHQAASPASGAW